MKQNNLLQNLLFLRGQTKRNGIKAFLPLLVIVFLITGCSDTVDNDTTKASEVEQAQEVEANNKVVKTEEPASTDSEQQAEKQTTNTREYNGVAYTVIEVDGGDLSGDRQANVAVNIGFGDREYWSYTNEHGQLVYVTADKIILQDDSTEPVNSDGRYYSKQADVPGIETNVFDRGHVIADSLGGVSNAYNITPQNSTLNRHGDQAYMEKAIRDADGCENFVATITYPDTETQIPSHYHFKYTLNGETITDDFDNVNPDEVNAALNQESNESATSSDSTSVPATSNSVTESSTTTTQDTEAVEQTEVVEDNTVQTSIEVHVTNTGKKYHSAGCQYLSKSDIITTLDKAKASGLGPCSKCNPPQ